MPNVVRWILGVAVALFLVAVPWVYFRATYAHGKRLREVVPGRVYRSGQLTAEGFADAVRRLGLRTIVNVQDDVPDPDVECGFFRGGTVTEYELCRQLGVRYVFIAPDLIARRRVPAARPEAIDQFLAVMDDPTAYPVLIHCRAGLHRTGVLTAVYRMEYQGWTPREAIRELKANGFGEFVCHSANDYITQYILTFRPGVRHAVAGDAERVGQAPTGP